MAGRFLNVRRIRSQRKILVNLRFQSGFLLLSGVVLLSAASASAQWTPQPALAPAAPAPPAMPGAFPYGFAFAPQSAAAQTPSARSVTEKTGFFIVGKDAQQLRLETDTGNVVIHTGATDQVRYRVHVETDASPNLLDQFRLRAQGTSGGILITGRIPDANARAHLWLSYDVTAPRDFRIDVNTAAGNIQVDDTTGAVVLDTRGGNITIGRAASAHLLSGGGHIIVGDITGDLHAETVGGHISAANIGGDAALITGGGHVHAGTIAGVAQISTGGGNISVDRAGSRVTASSAGGQIIFGEARGAIQAHTAGGGIRVIRVAGPMQLDSNGGSILLTQVEKEVHASTGAGSITAWFSPGGKLAAPSQLESGHGDIVVYLPRDLAMTIDATVDSPSDHRILYDPSLPMKLTYISASGGKQVHGECALNGGGEVLHLRAASGNIQLRVADNVVFLRQQMLQQQMLLQMDLAQRQLEELSQELSQSVQLALQKSLKEQQLQMQMDMSASPKIADNGAGPAPRSPNTPGVTPAGDWQPAIPPPAASMPSPPPDPGMPEVLWMRLGELWWGGIPVDYSDEQKRLIHDVQPAYPDTARQAGIEGNVTLRLLIGKDGHVQEVRPLSGQLLLVSAAIAAVKEWRYKPMLLDGQAQPVVTTVSIGFRLQ